mmetsp:Transcript_87492/g.276464  ORF Transcript_87492/g.276464 Transcript_87492/m.276464 type:complete len:289 (-) Transcript_87492:358-1224(-)
MAQQPTQPQKSLWKAESSRSAAASSLTRCLRALPRRSQRSCRSWVHKAWNSRDAKTKLQKTAVGWQGQGYPNSTSALKSIPHPIPIASHCPFSPSQAAKFCSDLPSRAPNFCLFSPSRATSGFCSFSPSRASNFCSVSPLQAPNFCPFTPSRASSFCSLSPSRASNFISFSPSRASNFRPVPLVSNPPPFPAAPMTDRTALALFACRPLASFFFPPSIASNQGSSALFFCLPLATSSSPSSITLDKGSSPPPPPPESVASFSSYSLPYFSWSSPSSITSSPLRGRRTH